MITKFIGSATELKYCSKLAIVYTYSSLLESRIPQYTPDNGKIRIVVILDRLYDADRDYYYFKYQVPKEGVSFNALIMYTLDMKPIGFTLLDNPVSTKTYSIQEIEVNLNFTINYRGEQFLELDLGEDQFSFATHNVDIANQHKQLFKKLHDYALKYSEIKQLDTHKSDFTNNIHSGLNGKVHRYSGNLMIGDKKITSKEWEVPRWLLNETRKDDLGICQESKLIKLEDRLYLIYWTRDTIALYDMESEQLVYYNPKTYPSYTNFGSFGDWTILYFGSNFFVTRRTGDGYDDIAIFDTLSLLKGKTELISGLNEISRIPYKGNEGLRFTRNPLDQSLMVYRITETGLKLISLELVDAFDRLGLTDKLGSITEIIAATKGTVIYKDKGISSSRDNLAPNALRIQTNVPLQIAEVPKGVNALNVYRGTSGEPRPENLVTQGEFNEIGGLYDATYPDEVEDNVIKYVIYGSTIELLSKSPIEYIFHVDDIQMISDKAILLKRKAGGITSWCLMDITNDENDINSFSYNYKCYNLGNKGNWRKLDMLARNRLNPLDKRMDILMSPVDGLVWKMIGENWEDLNSKIKVSML